MKAEDLMITWVLVYWTLAIGATVMALLGTIYWLLPAVLAIVALLRMLHFKRIGQRDTDHGWNRHKKWEHTALVCLFGGVFNLAAAVLFLIFGDPHSLGWVLAINGALIVSSVVVMIAVDRSQLDL